MVHKIVRNESKETPCRDDVIITDFEAGEIICQNCGKVLQERISDPRKDRSFSGEDISHIGDKTSITFHDQGLSSIIGKYNIDFVGRRLSPQMRQTMNRMRIWDSRSVSKSSSARNLRHALSELNKLKEKLGLSDAVIERAAYIYRKVVKVNLVRGRQIESMVGACLYIACRDMDTARTIRDISSCMQIKPKLIAKSYKTLCYNMKLKVPVPDIINTIIKISNNLQVSEYTKREAIKIYDFLKEKEITTGKNPHAVAATVVYMAGIRTNCNLTQKEISEISGITSVTVRNRLQDFKKYVQLV